MSRSLAGAALVTCLFLGAPSARADVGPPDRSCTVEKRCPGTGVECRYVNSQPDAGDLQCAADAASRGLDRVCSRGGGTVGVDVYCPKGAGTKPASGCAAAPGVAGSAGALGAVALMFVAGVVRRRALSPRARSGTSTLRRPG